MPRIPKSEIDALKRTVSLLSLVKSQGYTVKKQGKDYAVRCPFHEEKTPSMVISPDKNLYHCFGCGEAGSVIDWQMKTAHQSLPDAVAFLRDGLTTSLAVDTSSQPSSFVTTTTPRIALADLDNAGQALLHQVVNFYHQQFLTSPEAQEWLVRRGLNHPELVTHFKLGYAGKHGVGGAAGVLPSPYTKAGRQMRDRLASLGVLRESTKQDHFRGCVVVPIIGWSGAASVGQRERVMQLYGRRSVEDAKVNKGSAKHLYLPAPLSGVWNEEAMQASSDIILCEALIDAMTFWCAGFRHVVASFGVNGVTDDLLCALQYHGVKRVLIAFDRDEAGDTGAVNVAADLLTRGIDVWRVHFPQGMDANAYALKSGHAESALNLALQQAQWMGHGSAPDTVFTHEQKCVSPITSALAVPAHAPAAPIACEQTSAGELLLRSGARVWRVRGWQKNRVPEVMKVNVQVRDEASGLFHVDTLDMYHARHRQGFISAASVELECEPSVIKRECGRVLLMLEQQQDKQRQSVEDEASTAVTVSADDETAALELLKSPELIRRVRDDLASCGVVGESTNLLVGYLAAVSRKLDKPLAVLIQSSSAAGKSSLMEAILGLFPEEERIQYSAMTGQSLYYLGERSLQHKILAIAEEEGVRQAAYALKLLQSDGELNIASTGKNEQSGELVTREYKVQGPVMLMLTTTAIDVDEELLNRCLVLTVNESREQTQAIHALQRQHQTLDGLLAVSEKGYLTQLHQNAQRLLRPLKVVNPFAHQLTFLSDKTRTRRDHMKYLTLIQAIALLHQYQRPVKTVTHRGDVIEYIDVIESDITLANTLAHDVLGRTLDEMPPQTRKLLVLLKEWLTILAEKQGVHVDELHFTRRDVRAELKWGDTQLKVHLARLLEMEYLLLHRRGLTYEYTLLWDGEDNAMPHLCGLLDVERGSNKTAKTEGNAPRSGLSANQSVSGRGKVGEQSAQKSREPSQPQQGVSELMVGSVDNAIIKAKNKTGSLSLPSVNSTDLGA
ncbi:CHC2 zinc finger domain-containing protein [Providencia rettgeri]